MSDRGLEVHPGGKARCPRGPGPGMVARGCRHLDLRRRLLTPHRPHCRFAIPMPLWTASGVVAHSAEHGHPGDAQPFAGTAAAALTRACLDTWPCRLVD